MRPVLDIGNPEHGLVAEKLSNFTPHAFEVDGVICTSMEGFLQSLKYEDARKQIEVCRMSGVEAKFAGKKRNKQWKSTQTLWWRGVRMSRDGDAYQTLLDRAFTRLAENIHFYKLLTSTGDMKLTHSYGSNDSTETVLTNREFLSRLVYIRSNIMLRHYIHGVTEGFNEQLG